MLHNEVLTWNTKYATYTIRSKIAVPRDMVKRPRIGASSAIGELLCRPSRLRILKGDVPEDLELWYAAGMTSAMKHQYRAVGERNNELMQAKVISCKQKSGCRVVQQLVVNSTHRT